MTDQKSIDISAVLKSMNHQDFLTLGLHNVAYVKPVLVENRRAYAIHAADGTPLSVMKDMSAAVDVILNNELDVVTVH